MIKKIILLVLFFASTLAMGQTKEDPLRVSLAIVHNKVQVWRYDGLFNFSELEDVGLRVGAELYINPSFNTSLNFSRGKMRHERIYSAVVSDLSANLIYKFNNGYILKENARFAPFLLTGFGISNTQKQDFFFDEFDGGIHPMIPFGVGVDIRMNEKTDITLSGTYNNTIDDTYNYLQLAVGVKFSLQRDKDRDEDGVLDRNDPCPDIAGPVTNSGCPLEEDKVNSAIDNSLKDDDKDGVPNSMDACPQVAGSLNGCPDQDGDMVPDIYDACPTKAGKPALGGCPDRDNDGVIDSQDPCPDTYGTIRGCTQKAIDAMAPDSKEAIRIKLIMASESILFNSNSATLTGNYQKSLNEVLQVLKENPTLKIRINGYADSQGAETYNNVLSKQRSAVVKKWFTDQGIPNSRLESESYGELRPTSTNATAVGRALNRNVHIDFVIMK
jgi:outer membrane protein OmpA-like peptidoglycan-associated protein